MSVYIGIDPGATGAIAKVSTEGWAEVEKMPKFDVEFGWHLANLIPSSFTTRKGVIYLEEVHGRGGWGANANYSFGLASGYVLGGLSAWGIEPVMVTPQKWQKALDAKPYRGEAQKKRRSKERVAELYPDAKNYVWSSDAILIAHYAMLQDKEREYGSQGELPLH